MSCGWIGTLRRASYRGAAFFVETDSITTGRRLEVHEFPHKDIPYVEDLGRKANRIRVTAYVVGEGVGGAESALRNACDAGGAAALNLPMARTRAHCEECSRDYSKDKLGYIAFQLSFVVEGTRPAPFIGLQAARGIEFAAGRIGTAAGAAMVATFQGVGVPGWVTDAATEQLIGFADDFHAAVIEAPINTSGVATLVEAVNDFIIDVPDLVQIGDRGDRYTSTSWVRDSVTSLDTGLAQRVVGLFEDVREALAPEYAAEFMVPWLTRLTEAPPPLSKSSAIQAQNTRAIDNLVRTAAASHYAAAAALRTYGDRREAIKARADAAEYFEAAISLMEGWAHFDVYVELTTMRDDLIDMLSRQMATLSSVLQITAARRLPSLWWANRLYGDANRASEIVARNRVKHPSFCPVEMEALAE